MKRVSDIRWKCGAATIACSAIAIMTGSAVGQEAAPAPTPAAETGAAEAKAKPEAKPKADAAKKSARELTEASKVVLGPETGVVVAVDGRRILYSDVERRVIGQYSQQLAELPEDQQDFMRARVEQTVIEELIDRALLANAATAEEKYAAPDAAVDQRLEEMKGRLPAGADLTAALDQLGLTEASLREEVRVELAINKLLEEKMSTVTEPPAAEVRKFYDDNPTFFTRGATATASHILISTEGAVSEEELAAKKKKAEEVRAMVTGDAAKDFAEIAKTQSDCPSCDQGGMLGEFEKGSMVPEFEEAAFTQKTGDIGPVVKTDFGYHIIRVEKRSDGEVAPFEEVSESLPSYLARQRKQEAVESFVKQLRESADIQRATG